MISIRLLHALRGTLAVLLLGAFGFARGGLAKVDLPADSREVGIQFDQVEDASGYEVEVQKKQGDEFASLYAEPQTSKTSSWSDKLPPGTYRLRLRTRDHRGVPGPWGEFREFAIKEPGVQLTAPADKSAVSGKVVEFAWQALPSATAYEVRVTDDHGREVARERVTEPKAGLPLAPGARYQWQVQAFADDGKRGEDGATWSLTLRGGRLKRPDDLVLERKADGRVLHWSAPEHAASFAVTIAQKDHESGAWQDRLTRELPQDTSFDLPRDLTPGTYRVRVVAKADLWDESKAASKTFKVSNQDPTASEFALYWLRLSGRYEPTYWRHSGLDGSEAGISFDVVASDAVALAAEGWSESKLFGAEVTYQRLVTALFDSTVSGSGTDGQAPLQLIHQDLALDLKTRLAWRLVSVDGIVGAGQQTEFFFYKESLFSIAASSRAVQYVSGGVCLRLVPSVRTEWSVRMDSIHLASAGDITLDHAQAYKVDASLARALMPHVLVRASLDYGLTHLDYHTEGVEGAGHTDDITLGTGIGLELLF